MFLFPVIFLYGVCRFPITRGTGEKVIDAGFIDFLNLAYIWFLVALVVSVFLYLIART